MDEFKDVMYCPFCDKYLPKKEWFCIFCLHNTINYESWKYKSIDWKEKWKLKHPPMATPRTAEERAALPEKDLENLENYEGRMNDFDARYRAYLADMAAPHTPKCPVCGSPDLQKISATSKVLDVAIWGWASKKPGKQFKCGNCGYEF